MTTAWVPLATTTLSSSAASVTFGSIPSEYRDLVLALQVRSTYAGAIDYLKLNFNADYGANYSYVFMQGSGSAASSNSGSTENEIVDATFTAATQTAGVFTPVLINIQDFSATNKHKTTISRASTTTTSAYVTATAGRWANTNAITSVTLSCLQSGASFAAGSTFSLYGSNRL